MIDHADERRNLVTDQLVSRGIRDPRVLEAFLAVPRHLFVREEDTDLAHADRPLTIGHGQTISQPFIVALTLEQLGLLPSHRVLEIGTGSGFQTALLSHLVAEVWTIERIPQLAEVAKQRLDALELQNIHYRVGDGTLGWPEAAPFDAIAVSAAGPKVPESLRNQLAPGGRLVIPVGKEGDQDLRVVTRGPDGFVESSAGGCIFVKLIGQEGWSETKSF